MLSVRLGLRSSSQYNNAVQEVKIAKILLYETNTSSRYFELKKWLFLLSARIGFRSGLLYKTAVQKVKILNATKMSGGKITVPGKDLFYDFI